MKIGLLTLDSHIYNYGGALQEYALLTVLKSFGDAEIIDYDLTSELYTFSAKRSLKYLTLEKVAEKAFGRLKGKTSGAEDVSQFVRARKQKFDEFRSTHMALSERYVCADLEKLDAGYDAIVCGSDQIWNPDYNVPSFFLNFADHAKKIIYAASIGKSDLREYQKKIYGSYIDRIDFASVRESSAKKLLEDYTDTKLSVVVDPTLLLERAEWLTVAEPVLGLDAYIFCYFLQPTKEKINAATEFAKKHHKTLVSIPYLHHAYDEFTDLIPGIKLSEIGPAEFLGMILHADTILTDSFHATVFSILFGRPFWTFGRVSGKYNMNTRLDTLLAYFDLQEKMILPKELVDQKISAQDYHYDKAMPHIEDSIKYLGDALVS